MKKVVSLLAVLMLIPFTAYGMQSMDQQEMSEVTGQSGVAITVDDVVLHESASEIWYQNNLEADGDMQSGAVGMVEEGQQTTFINAIVETDPAEGFESAGNYGLKGEYDALAETSFDPSASEPSPITIQVGQMGVLAEAQGTTSAFVKSDEAKADATGVVIGLPTVEIHEEGSTAMQLLVSDSGNPTGDTRADNDGVSSFGTLYSGGDTMAVLDGRLEITPVEEIAD